MAFFSRTVARSARDFVRTSLMLLCVFSASSIFAATWTVTTTADTNDGSCGATCSLRDAVIAANAGAGGDQITLGSGLTYNLTLGSLNITNGVTINGNTSTVDGGGIDRVFTVQGNVSVTIGNLTIQNGVAKGFLSTGGGIYINGATVVLNNCTVTNNSTAVESGARDDGGGLAVYGSYSTTSALATLAHLTLNGSTVSGNTGLNGGGILCALCALTVSSSTIGSNAAVGGDGGGIDVVGNASTVSISKSTLTGNTVTGGSVRGGGLSVPFGTSVSTLNFDRIAGNTATLGGGIFNSAGTINGTDNWWGTNTPATTISGTVTFDPFIVLAHTASPSTIRINQSATLTADMSKDNHGSGAALSGNLDALNGVPITFNAAVLGTIPNAQPEAMNSSAQATATYNAGSAGGSGSANAVVDQQTVTASLAVVVPPAISKSFGAVSIPVNGTTTLRFTITNSNTVTLNGVGFTDNLPAGLVVATPNGLSGPCNATSATATAGSTSITLSGASLGSGAQCTFSVNVTGIATGVQNNITGAVTSTEGGTGGTASATVQVTRARADFNGDGRTDALWRNGSTGQNSLWLMNGTATITSSVTLAVTDDPNWQLSGVADFNGDGLPDILWRNASTGQVAIWLMNGTSLGSATTIATVPLNFQIVGVGDVNQDGKADIFWWNSTTGDVVVWLMNGTVASGTTVGTVADTNWHIVGVGDFNGDGMVDVFWRNMSTGADGIWFMNGASVGSTASTNAVADLNWQVVGIGDANGDGKADVVWHHAGTGSTDVWLMNGANPNGAVVGTAVDTNWHIEAVGDFDGDGNVDLLWRNVTTGDVNAWLLNGLTIKQSGVLATGTSLNWSIVAPR